MDAIQLIVAIALMGLLVWAITTLVPMPAQFKNIIVVVAVVIAVLYVLSAFAILPEHVLPNRR